MYKPLHQNNIFAWLVVIIFALAVITTFGKPYILRSYIETTIGDCLKNPILCISPDSVVKNPEINKEFIKSLGRFKIDEIEISLPKDFKVVKEQIHRAYYKKQKRKQTDSVAYLLYQKSGFFGNLFPQLKKLAVMHNYDFLSRIANAKTKNINNLSDTMFVILKSVFTPDLGSGQTIKVVSFEIADKKGFIYYNSCASGNYFNCDIVNAKGEFYKVYLKDKKGRLDLNKALAIISSLNDKSYSYSF